MGSNHHQKAQDNTTTQSCMNQQQHKQQSPTSSPSHEFSFTISLHSNTFFDKNKTTNNNNDNNPSSFAMDLTPADDIFFHGHLLPLHLLSHLPVSPRSSTNSLDSFTLPIQDLLDEQNPTNPTISDSHTTNSNNENSSATWNHHPNTVQAQEKNCGGEKRGRVRSKSFSIFGIPRWKKLSDVREKEEKDKEKRKLRFDVSHAVKRYMRMVRPFLSLKGGRREDGVDFGFGRQAHSFSGKNSNNKSNNFSGRKSKKNNRHELKGGGIGRGDFYSAPASMRTSPSNSGLLVATTPTTPPPPIPSTNDSTMEELQAAIQAAIAHCKNSIAMEEQKLKAN